MIIIRNLQTGYVFELEDNAGAELLRCNPLTFEIVKATKEALKQVETAKTPTDEQRLLGEKPQDEIEEKYKDVEIIPEMEEVKKTSKRKAKNG